MKRYIMDTSDCGRGHCGPVECPTGDYYHRADLIAAGVLVPVPDGDAWEVQYCDASKLFALHNGEIVVLRYDHHTGETQAETQDDILPPWRIVQPVCLVPIAEATHDNN